MNFVSAALRHCLAAATVSIGVVATSPEVAFAQGYGQPYAPPPAAYGRRPIDQSPRTDLPLYRPNIWQGLYVGGTIGGDWGKGWPAGYSNDAVDMSGVAGSLHVGNNWINDRFMAGFEIDMAAKSTDGSRAFAGPLRADLAHDWLASFRLRLGFTLGDAMLYATGGYAVGHLDVALTTPLASAKASESIQGWVLGGGLEMKLAPNLSGRIEGLHYGFTEKSFGFPGGSARGDANLSTVRAGVSYHFN